MDFLAGKKVARVVRVVPHPHKDIGFNLMSRFHYGKEVRIATFESLTEAREFLDL